MKSHPSKLDLTKPVQTRSGIPIRIICTDRPNCKQTVIGLFPNGEVGTWYPDGRYLVAIQEPSEKDLVNTPETVRVCLVKHESQYASQVLKGFWTEEYCKTQWGADKCTFHDIEIS